MTIQWFPGHMAKTLREIKEKMKLVDIVIELVDARCPLSTTNIEIGKLTANKPRLIIMTKKDLADANVTKSWQEYYRKQGIKAISLDLRNFNVSTVTSACFTVLEEKIKKDKARGLKKTRVRAMIVGIPNVGKSTFINSVAKRKAVNVGNVPGVTRLLQWITVSDEFNLLDTPGVLWPKFEDQLVGYNLAAIGSIKDSILNLEEICLHLLEYLKQNYEDKLEKKYGISDINLEKIGIVKNVVPYDSKKVVSMILRDFRLGNLGKISLERPEFDEVL